MVTLTISQQREFLRHHAAELRSISADIEAIVGAKPGFAKARTRVAETVRIAALFDACADTDNPLAGALALLDMQAAQHPAGDPREAAWRGVAYNVRYALAVTGCELETAVA